MKIRAFNQKAFTLLEMLVAIIILVIVSAAVFQIFNDFLFRSRRLSTLSYSNQEIEKLRTMIFRDMRAATAYEISEDGMELKLICAIDEAAIKENKLEENTKMATESFSGLQLGQLQAIMGGMLEIHEAEGGDDVDAFLADEYGVYSSNIYYTVTYTYLPEDVYTAMTVMDPRKDIDPSADQSMTFYSGPGMWRLRRGVIVRSGPPFNPATGSIDFDRLRPYMKTLTSTPEYPPGIIVSDVWAYTSNQIGGIFAYYHPDKVRFETEKEGAVGVSVMLFPRQIFGVRGHRTERVQAFETIVTPRTRR